MSVEDIVSAIQQHGFRVVENVIPDQEVRLLRKSLLDVGASQGSDGQRREAKIRAKGHRVGAKGVTNITMLIHWTQEFAPFLADERVLGVAEAFFGPHVRITSTSGIVNYPGNERGYWHSDWPFNQTVASHIPAPYPDVTMHLTTIWMLSPFNAQTGGTLIVPESHRLSHNPSGDNGVDRDAPYPGETHATGNPGSVLIFDSRLWHAVAPNRSAEPRVAMTIRYAPWWLNLNPEKEGTPEHQSMVVEANGKGSSMPPLRKDIFDALPEDVKPLFHHAVS